MNAYFREPLVQAIRGGPEHGGATLTETGQKALKIYQQMEKDFSAATTQRWKELRALLRE
jgi:molybdate transport system regulatory protein